MADSSETQEKREPQVDRVELLRGDTARDTIHATLVHGADLVHERERTLTQPAPTGSQRRIQSAFACRTADRHDGDKAEALVGRDVRVADDDAGPLASLFVADRRIEQDENDSASIESHLAPIQPRPGTQRTETPARRSSRSDAFWSGSLMAQSSKPASASSLVSG